MPNPTSKLNLVINGTTTQLDIHDANAVDLTNNQTVGGNKEFTGITTAHDLVPSATETYNFGSPSVQWNNAYIKSLTINGVACGDILTHNVSEFVNVSSDQTIAGVKKFSDIPIVVNGKSYVSQINANRTDGTQTGFSAYNGFRIVCNNDSQGWNNTAFAIHISEYSPTAATVGFKLYDCIEGSTSYKGFLFRKNNNDFQFSPTASNLIGLGSSTNKWKSFNGVNPGALSLPSSNVVNILSELQSDGYTAPSNGYVRAIKDVQTHCASTFGIRNETTGIEDRKITERIFTLGVIVPAQAGEKVVISDNWNSVDNATIIYSAYFYPCQGNV